MAELTLVRAKSKWKFKNPGAPFVMGQQMPRESVAHELQIADNKWWQDGIWLLPLSQHLHHGGSRGGWDFGLPSLQVDLCIDVSPFSSSVT